MAVKGHLSRKQKQAKEQKQTVLTGSIGPQAVSTKDSSFDPVTPWVYSLLNFPFKVHLVRSADLPS